MFFPFKRNRRSTLFLSLAMLLCLGAATEAAAGAFKIGIMQAQIGAAKKYAPLENYLNKKGIEVRFVPFATFGNAADMFDHGEVDAMFSGSGVAGIFILKGLAIPLVRPVDTLGRSTYWAVVVGRKGSPPFTALNADYFAGKRVAYSTLASAGEFFYKSLLGAAETKATTVNAANHQDALEKLARGEVDFAIVKNTVWDTMRDKFPSLDKVGQDPGQNPNDTLIAAKKADPETIKSVVSALMAVETDPEAGAVRAGLGVKGFAITSANDFASTLALLKRAGITAQYSFR